MLTPEKYMDLDKSLLYSTMLVLKYLLKNKSVKLETLRVYLEDNIEANIGDKLLNSLTILYAMGKIDYLDKNDTIVITN